MHQPNLNGFVGRKVKRALVEGGWTHQYGYGREPERFGGEPSIEPFGFKS